jgi:hypothetical protein
MFDRADIVRDVRLRDLSGVEERVSCRFAGKVF